MRDIGIVYTYMPIENRQLMRKLEYHIESHKYSDRAVKRIEMLPAYLPKYNDSFRDTPIDFWI